MNNKGYTLVEILTILGIMVALLMIASINFFPIKQKTSLSTSVQSLISDIKQEQNKSMNGGAAQGVYLGQSNYTIFNGTTYLVSNSTNFSLPYGDQIVLSSDNFSNNQIIFASVSGQISGAQPNNNQIILKNSVSGQQSTISINQFGVVTNVQ